MDERGTVMIQRASDLRSTAQDKIKQDQEDMEAWVENLAESITDTCQEAADIGEMSLKIYLDDLLAFVDEDAPEEKWETVIRGACKLLVEEHGYKIQIDDFNPKTKDQGDISSIVVDWSGK